MKTKIRKMVVSGNKRITVTLKSNAINIFEEPLNNLWTFDIEGRLIGMYVDNKNYRRTLDNKFFLKSRKVENDEVFRQVTNVPLSEIIPLLEQVFLIITEIQPQLPFEYNISLLKILKIGMKELQERSVAFSNIYLPISILPPDQYMSLVVQITEGCNYNKCTFCNFYHDRPFKIKSINELELHIKQIKSFFGDGLELRKSIFLADANAISVPQKRLIESINLINIQFPQFKNLYSFVDVFTGIKKSANDYKVLKELGLKRVYLGIESGNHDLMLFLNKPQLYSDIIDLTKNIKKGGVNVGIILLVGAGGEHFAENHIIDSIDLLKHLPISKGDIIYLSELYETNSEYIESMNSNNIALPSKLEIRQWSNKFRSTIKGILPKGVQVAVYDINQFFY